jgi:hypothetical protein
MPQWRRPAESRFEQLLQLEWEWDGYSAAPVSLENATFAYRMLESICLAHTPAPQIVPGTSRDLQIEWHLPRGSIELWVRNPNNILAWRVPNDGNDEQELDLTTDFAVVSDWLKQIM